MVLGEPFGEYFRVVHPRTRVNLENLLIDCLQADENFCRLREQVVVVRQNDGRAFQAELTVSPCRHAGASQMGLVVAFHDVTTARELENQLTKKVLELDVIVKSAGVGIAFVQGGVVQRVNGIASEIIGLVPERIVGTSGQFILENHLGYGHPVDQMYERMSHGQSIDIEHRVDRPDQKPTWLRLIGQAVDPERLRENGTVWILQDITALKQHQEDLRRAKIHAEEASRFKSEFLAHVSHELRSPLSGIIGMNRLVLETNLDRSQRQNLTVVQASAETLLQLINNLLDLSKIEAGVMELEKRPFALASVGEYITNVLSLRFREKGLSFSFSVADTVPVQLIGDELRLGQILLNLVGNAVKFTSEGGVRVRCEKIGQAETAVKLRFTVADSGCGIDAAARAKIFGAYIQATSSVARTHGGSGLGLSICRQLTELMGGEIDVESEPGAGSTFSFTCWCGCQQLPKSDVSAEAEVVRQPREVVRRALRLLLVEDIPFNQTIAKILLEREEHSVRLAANGREALQALTESSFDAIFMDVMMPVMDGLTATRLIRRCETEDQPHAREDNVLMRAVSARIKGGHLPIIAMTGNLTDAAKRACSAAGMDSSIAKPFDGAEMQRALDVVVVAAHDRDTDSLW